MKEFSQGLFLATITDQREMQQTAKLLIDDSGCHVDLKNSINDEIAKRDQFPSRTKFIHSYF